MNYRDANLRSKLAAEYVLGTLRGAARRRMTHLAVSNADLRNSIRWWEQRLLPFIMSVPPIAPPARVWDRIAARVFPAQANVRGLLLGSLFLRMWAGVATVAALALGVALLMPGETPPPENYVAMLADDHQQLVMAVTADRRQHILTVKTLAPIQLPTDKSMQLWALPEAGAPRPLGLVSVSGKTELALPANADSALQAVPAMAVSIEPAGGSPSGLPTGPVVYKGTIVKVW